jgi:hypothetical protein
LLDQVSAQSLNRLASERWDAPNPERKPSAQVRRVSPLKRLLQLGLPPVMLAFGALVTAGMVFGTVDALSNGGDASWQDALRIAIMALLSLLFLFQLVAFLRRLPGVSHIAARLQRDAPPVHQALLDQVSAGNLMRLAPADLGRVSRRQLATARGRHFLDAGSWLALVAAVIGIAVFMGAGAALGAWSALGDEGLGAGALLRLLFLAVAAVSLAFLVYFGLKGLRRRQQRRRGRLLRRLLYFLLRIVHSGRNVVSDAAGVSSRAGDLALVRSGGSAFFPSGGGSVLGAPAAIFQAASTAPTAFAVPASPAGGVGAAAGAGGAATGGGTSVPGVAGGAQGGFVPPSGDGGGGAVDGGGLVTPPGGGGGGPAIDGGLATPPGGQGGPAIDGGGFAPAPPDDGGLGPALDGGLVNPGGGGGGGFNFHGGLVNPGGGNGGGYAFDGDFLAPFDPPGGGGQSFLIHPGGFDWDDGDPPVYPLFKPAVFTGSVLALAFLPFLFGGGESGGGGGGGGPSPILGGGGIITIAPTFTPTPSPTATPTAMPTETPTEAATEQPAATQVPSQPQQPSATPPPASTSTSAPSSTPIPTLTPTPQPTLTPSPTPSRTPPPTRTPTPRPTRTPKPPCTPIPGGPPCP